MVIYHIGVGTRVRFRRVVVRRPFFSVPAGLKGTIAYWDMGIGRQVRVRLDQQLRGAEQSGNEVAWMGIDLPDINEDLEVIL